MIGGFVTRVSIHALAIALVGGCSSDQKNAADDALKAVYSSEWLWRQDQLPDDEDSQRSIQDHLPSVTPTSEETRLHYWQKVVEKLDRIDRNALSDIERLNYEVYRPQIEALIADQNFQAFQMPANSDTTFWTNLGVTARRPFRTLRDYQNWVAQMRDIPRYFREQIDEMRDGLKRGFTPPRVTLLHLDGSIMAVTDAAPEASLFYTPFKDMPGVAEADQVRLRSEALTAIHDQVKPAYSELLKFMRAEYIPAARTTIAAQDLPGGEAFYRAAIRKFTSLDADPATIHRIGEEQVARITEEMTSAMQESGFKGDLPAFLDHLRIDPAFYAKTPEELLMRAAWIAKRFDGKAPLFFGYLPRPRFTIRPVPDDVAPFYTAGRGGPGVYLLNTYDLPSRPLYNLTALTLHESAPGHAFQMPIAMEHADQPEFRRHTYISAYGEGWALYCERLGVEMGMYDTPYDRFGMLGYQIWRAARLVVDTGIHAQGWTRDRAIDYFRQHTALSDHEIQTEIDRYITWPGQALSYYLGEMAIVEARSKAEKALGNRFNIRAFHDTVLELGSVPLPVLTARVDRFITEGGQGPYPDLE